MAAQHSSDAHLSVALTHSLMLMRGAVWCGVACVGGKTEIARRLARVLDAPFVKVEATKFTEIGFHGRDVDSIIGDLVRVSIGQMKAKRRRQLREKVRERVEAKLLDALTGPGGQRADFLSLLRAQLLDQQEVEIEVPIKQSGAGAGAAAGMTAAGSGLSSSNFSSSDDASAFSSSSAASSPSEVRVLEFALRGLTGGGGGKGRKELRKLLIADARPLLEEAEYEAAMSSEDVTKEAIKAVEEGGVVFLDEVDKICSPASSHRYADASAEGVQRDLLPLLEGTTVSTKHGDVRSDYILWVAAGAFHAVKPSDLLAELQGRLPIRAELRGLTEEEMYTVLTQTENNLIQQQIALLQVDGVHLTFTDDAIRHIAKGHHTAAAATPPTLHTGHTPPRRLHPSSLPLTAVCVRCCVRWLCAVACEVNQFAENIGARRLHTIIEKLCDDVSFDAPDLPAGTQVVIDKDTVQLKMQALMQQTDLTRFLL